MTTSNATWPALLVDQDQVLSRRGARLAGMSEDAWQWRLETGRLTPLLPGVAVGHAGPPTARQMAWAAVLSAGIGAVLTGDGALRELGFELDVWRWDVLIPAHREVRDKRWVQVAGRPPLPGRICGRAVPASARLRGSGALPLVVPELAALHAAEWATSDRAAEWRVAAAVQRGLCLPSALRQQLASAGLRHRGELVRSVLDDVELGAHARSELDFLTFLREHGLPLPDRLQRPVRRNGLRYLDAWWERRRVAAEVDGGHHRLAATWDADTLRHNDVVLAERDDRVLMLRLTMGNLRHDRPLLARQFADALL
jgi:hypothetical protein